MDARARATAIREIVSGIENLTGTLLDIVRESAEAEDDRAALDSEVSSQLTEEDRITDSAAKELWAIFSRVAVKDVTSTPLWWEIVEKAAYVVSLEREASKIEASTRRELKDERAKVAALKRQLDRVRTNESFLQSTLDAMTLSFGTIDRWIDALTRVTRIERRGAVSAWSVNKVRDAMQSWKREAQQAQWDLLHGEDDDDDFENFDDRM